MRALAAVLPTIAVFLAACSSGGNDPTGTAIATPVNVRPEIQKQVPAYEGYFADDNTDILYIYSTDPAIDVEALRPVLREHFGNHPRWDWRIMVFPDDSLGLITNWGDTLREILAFVEVTSYYYDPVSDQIVVGVETEQDLMRGNSQLEASHLPPAAVARGVRLEIAPFVIPDEAG